MEKQTFSKENLLSMDPMHDVKVKEIKIEGNTLIVSYENLRKDFFRQDGTPYYAFDKLTIHTILNRFAVRWRSVKENIFILIYLIF